MQNSWAVVTGASSGLGVTFAEKVASEGVNVLLAARTAGPMEELAARLQERHGVETLVVPVDLSDREARGALVDRLHGMDISYLINNAGFATIGDFAEADPDRMLQEKELNMVALTQLARAVAPGMISRGRGAIINVASTAAFQPIPTMAVYAATKAYVLRLTIALWEELFHTGVRAIAICPGPTDTPFFAEAGDDSKMAKRRTPAQVVETTFAGLGRHQPYVVDGASNALMAFATRLAPVRLQAALARWVATH